MTTKKQFDTIDPEDVIEIDPKTSLPRLGSVINLTIFILLGILLFMGLIFIAKIFIIVFVFVYISSWIYGKFIKK